MDSSILEEKLDYYGACQDIGLCSEDQKEVFPIRMKIWLDEVLHILVSHKAGSSNKFLWLNDGLSN